MKVLVAVTLLLLSFFLSGCTLPPKVSSDYDRNFDFSSLKHYRWLELPGDVEAEELMIQRLRNAVDKQMGIKGFTKSLESPDFLISMRGFKDTAILATPRGPSYQRGNTGGTRINSSAGSLRGREYRQTGYSPTDYEEGKLTVTLINAANDQTIWEGLATGLIQSNNSPESREQRTHETIARLLADFPPAKK
jgi:hypothetical protein